MKNKFSNWTKQIQEKICLELELLDGKANFETDVWNREEGGGGTTRTIKCGAIFEKGGVNTSEVYGKLSPSIKEQLKIDGDSFFACGVSVVIHPYSPKIPTVHANYRYFEVYNNIQKKLACWFGGGADLTPYYLVEEDAIHFHAVHKKSCDKFDKSYYSIFKTECDNYFVNHHRNAERRGIGGIFYDYASPNDKRTEEDLLAFAKSNGQALLDAYLPIVLKHQHESFTEEQKNWQLIRRGRYVEFNLIHDRGTIFGLKSNGRTESILMSLPLHVKFEYQHKVMPHSEEEKLLAVLLQPKNWV